jgi:hypothetical protein
MPKLTTTPLPQLGALFLGCATLFTAEATAAISKSTADRDQAASELLVKMEGEAVLISERGEAFREVSLESDAAAAYLRKLLLEAGAAQRAVTVPAGSFIVANGGGQGPGPAATMVVQKKRAHKPRTKRSKR